MQAYRNAQDASFQLGIEVPRFNIQHYPESLVYGSGQSPEQQYSDDSCTVEDLRICKSFLTSKDYKTMWSNEVTEKCGAVPRLAGGAAFLQNDDRKQAYIDDLLSHTSQSGLTHDHQKHQTIASEYLKPITEKLQLDKCATKHFRQILDTCFAGHYRSPLDVSIQQAGQPDISLDQHLKAKGSSIWLQASSQDTTARGKTFIPIWRAVQDDDMRSMLTSKYKEFRSISLPSITEQMPQLVMYGVDCRAQHIEDWLVQDSITSIWFIEDPHYFQFAASFLCSLQQGYLCAPRVWHPQTEKKMRANEADLRVVSCLLTYDRDGKLGIYTVEIPGTKRLVSMHVHYSAGNQAAAINLVHAAFRAAKAPAKPAKGPAPAKASKPTPASKPSGADTAHQTIKAKQPATASLP